MNPEAWRYIFDAIEDPMFLHDAECRLLLANRAYFCEAGVTGAEALGKPYWEVFPPGTGPLPGCRDAADRKGHGGSQEEVSIGDRLFLSKGYPVHDDQGKLRYSLHILSDITERKQQQDRVLLLNQRLHTLVGTIQKLALARDMESIMAVACSAARSLIGSDGSTFVLREGDQCFYADENVIRPLWKGQHFPMSTCISGWVMLNRQPAIIEDIYADARIPASAYRPTFVKSLAMVPICNHDPLGAMGNYWASPYLPTSEEMQLLQTLADATAIAVENVRLFDEQKQRLVEIKQVEAELRISANQLREAQRIGKLGFLDWNLNTNEIELSDEALRIYGLAPGKNKFQLEGITKLVHPDDVEYAVKSLHSAIEQGTKHDIEHRIIRADGAVLYVHTPAEVLRDANGKPIRMLGTVQDITERKEMESQLRNSEQRYRQIIQTSMDGFWIADTEARILEVNDPYCHMIGYSRDELIAMRIPDVEANERPEETVRHIREIMTKKGCDRFETRHRRKDGQLLEIEVSTVYQLDQEEGRFFGFLRDITERKRAEQALRAAMFALTVAEERERRAIAIDLHDDPGQLLAAANLKLSGLRRETDKAMIANAIEESRELIGQAQRSLRSLIFQVSPPVLFELGLVAALSWLAEEVQRIYGITVSVHDDGSVKPLDPTIRSLVFRAVRELVINVAKHARVKTADVDVCCSDGQMIVSVTDYGIGFEPDNIGKTGPEGGFGLLSIRERLGFIGGELDIDSAPGDGTVATLSVPLPAGLPTRA